MPNIGAQPERSLYEPGIHTIQNALGRTRHLLTWPDSTCFRTCSHSLWAFRRSGPVGVAPAAEVRAVVAAETLVPERESARVPRVPALFSPLRTPPLQGGGSSAEEAIRRQDEIVKWKESDLAPPPPPRRTNFTINDSWILFNHRSSSSTR